MQPLRYSINVTLDGCCDHRAGIADEALHHHAAENIARADALLFGRVIYEMMEAAWRPVAESGTRPDWMEAWMVPFGHTIHAAKKYVVSSTLGQGTGAPNSCGETWVRPCSDSSSSPAAAL